MDHGDLEPISVRSQVLMEMQNPKEILDQGRGSAPADVASAPQRWV
jgi:hypothetical protein